MRELEAKPEAEPQTLEALRKEKDDLARRVQVLEEALKGLEAAEKALETRKLEENLKKAKAEEALKELGDRLQALEGRPQADPREVEALKQAQEELKGRLKALEEARSAQEEALKRLEAAVTDLPEARRLAEEAHARLTALEPRVAHLEEKLAALEDRQARLEERLKALEEARTQDQARLKALEEEVAALKRTLAPSRLPLYLGLGLYQGDVTKEGFGRLLCTMPSWAPWACAWPTRPLSRTPPRASLAWTSPSAPPTATWTATLGWEGGFTWVAPPSAISWWAPGSAWCPT